MVGQRQPLRGKLTPVDHSQHQQIVSEDRQRQLEQNVSTTARALVLIERWLRILVILVAFAVIGGGLFLLRR
jgi:hypothetical protein